MKKSTRKNRARYTTVDFSQVDKAMGSKQLPGGGHQHSGAEKRKIRGRQWRKYKQDILEKIEDFSVIYADLEKQRPSGGKWISAQCLFHRDRKPSFSFNPENGRWICHAGCGEDAR